MSDRSKRQPKPPPAPVKYPDPHQSAEEALPARNRQALLSRVPVM